MKKEQIMELVNVMRTDSTEATEARNALFEEVVPYIGYIINNYYGTFRSEYADLHQEGCLAVLECLDKYDPEKAALTTFVTPYIRERLSKVVSETVNKTNKYYANKIRTVKASINAFNIQNIPWTLEDISLDTGLSIKSVKQTIEYIHKLDKHFSIEEEPAVVEAKPKHDTPEDNVIQEQEKTIIHDAIASLPEIQQKIVMYNFGFESDRPMKVPVIADRLGLDEAVIRKELSRALDTLRNKPSLHRISHNTINNSNQRIEEARKAFFRF